jgi:alpha-galactosidase
MNDLVKELYLEIGYPVFEGFRVIPPHPEDNPPTEFYEWEEGYFAVPKEEFNRKIKELLVETAELFSLDSDPINYLSSLVDDIKSLQEEYIYGDWEYEGKNFYSELKIKFV